MDVQKTAINLGKAAANFTAGATGLGLGVFGMNQVPASAPGYVRGIILILLGFLGAGLITEDNFWAQLGKSASFGVGAAGALDLVKQLTANSSNTALQQLNAKLPNLSGLPSAKPFMYGLPKERKLLGNTNVKRLLAA